MDGNTLTLIVMGGISLVVYSIFYFTKKKNVENVDRIGESDNYQASKLEDDQLKILALGAILTIQNECEHYQLVTSTDADSWRDVLRNYWGITNHDDTIETLDRLKNGGTSHIFDDVFNGLSMSESEYTNYIRSKYTESEYISKCISQRSHLLDAMSTLKSKKIIDSENSLFLLKSTAWDIGRLVSVARMAMESGYIDEDTFWRYGNEAMKIAKANFRSWDDYGKSYIIGRTLWRGKEAGIELLDIVKSLNTDTASPWMNLTF